MSQKNIKQQIKFFFFLNPSSKLRVREMERKLEIPLPSVIRYCKELTLESVLTIKKINNIVLYTANRTSHKYLLEKRLFNIRQIDESGLIDYFKQKLSNPPLILFGSYSKGEDTEESDIDLYVETSSKENLDLTKFENFLKRKIQLFKFKNIHKISNPYLANNIMNGITLNNYVEVFK